MPRVGYVGQHVALVEYFPYFSRTKPGLITGLPSQRYGFDLVSRAIAGGAVIVLTRSVREWSYSVPALATYDAVEVRNKRNPSITEANTGSEGWRRIVRALSL